MNQPSEVTDETSGPSREEITFLASSIPVSEGYPERQEEASWPEAERQLA